jgi:FkbM family methyltransferase
VTRIGHFVSRLAGRIRGASTPVPRHRKRGGIATERLGTEYGGWVIPSGFIGEHSICYCVGAGEDVSFDTQLAERFRANVWVMDPTPRAIRHFAELTESVAAGNPFPINRNPATTYDVSAEGLARIAYLPFGLWKTSDVLRFYAPHNPAHVSYSILNLQHTDTWFEAPVKRLSDVLRDLGHDHVDLLKLDVEGAEYEVLDTILEDRLDVRVICVEHHEWAQSRDARTAERLDSSISRMHEGSYVLVHSDHSANVLYMRKDVLAAIAGHT